MDTLRAVDVLYLSKIEKSVTQHSVTLNNKLNSLEKKIDTVEKILIENKNDENYATSGWQTFQTFLLVIILIGVILLLMYFYNKEKESYRLPN